MNFKILFKMKKNLCTGREQQRCSSPGSSRTGQARQGLDLVGPDHASLGLAWLGWHRPSPGLCTTQTRVWVCLQTWLIYKKRK